MGPGRACVGHEREGEVRVRRGSWAGRAWASSSECLGRGAIMGGRACDSHGHDTVEQDRLHDADGVSGAPVSALLACVKPHRARAVRAHGHAERVEGPTGGTVGRWQGTS